MNYDELIDICKKLTKCEFLIFLHLLANKDGLTKKEIKEKIYGSRFIGPVSNPNNLISVYLNRMRPKLKDTNFKISPANRYKPIVKLEKIK